MKLLKPFCLALPLALFFAQPAVAAEPGASPAAKANQCVGCHEIPGYRSVFPVVYPTPKIMGQSAAYIQTALKAYRDGTRDHPSMTGIAATLTDEDIRVLAEYYAGRGK